MSDKDVVLSIAKVEDEKRAEIEDLYQTLRDRKEETVECLAELDVISESAFLAEFENETYFMTYVESEDIERTQEQYQASDRELDVRHREVLEQSLAGAPVEVEPLLQADVPDRE